jgi:hypothetical protein
MGKNWASAGRASLGVNVRWSPTEHKLVPLDKALVERLRAAMPSSTTAAGKQVLLVTNIFPTPSTPIVHDTKVVCCLGHGTPPDKLEIGAIIGECYNLKLSISVLIDSGCLQTNIVSKRIAQLLIKDGNAKIKKAHRSLTAGLGGGNFETNCIVDFDIRFIKQNGISEKIHCIYIRALISPDIQSDLIIGLPTIQKYKLLTLLQSHLDSLPQLCEVCADSDNTPLTRSHHENLLINHITSITDPVMLTQHSESELTDIMHRLHISEVFETEEDDEALDKADITDILSQEAEGDLTIDIQGSPAMQKSLSTLVQLFKDIFSTTVKGKSAKVPPLDFNVDAAWETTANRLPSRLISPEKHLALHGMIEELLDLNVIKPSQATSWSQVHLVRKPAPSNGWRFTIDYRGLNKVITNQGWQIPNMSEMLQRIGSLRPKFFGIADLTSGFFQMPITDGSMQSTAFITFRGIYEWTRVPMGLLPSANYFQKMMAEYVLHGLIYIICEVYIDDLLIYGRTEEEFLRNVETIFNRLREFNVTLNPKKVHLGLSKIQFVGHEIDAEGINMSQKRVESTIDVIQPSN